ncbi:YhcG family protein [Curtobacterium sp. ISL-83]|uniref:PDDEXK nuclease domain-containing protein n=1 Tax=Curtobacterium sp. ISL-83 TaxID=2819145 RepID=UPI001BEA7E5C|nr:PDDEXK nuclease domain-containing protein [Curtobacterium sp. ISL-83]MBT2503508.1 DUF1016 family protein [Curtobacterium sp. ISL-83]
MTDADTLPGEYAEMLRSIRDRVATARARAQLAANTELVHLYWSIGAALLQRSRTGRWGSGVLAQLADDLRAEFPSMRGFSATNLKYMRQFAAAWPDESSIGQQAVDQLPWGHITVLLSVADASERAWYVRSAVDGAWSRSVLRHNVRQGLATRQGAAQTNFHRLLDDDGADRAQDVTRDPYVLDFLAVDGDQNERALEGAMVERITDTLRELGSGFAFVGRQVHFDVDGNDFFVDLLFFHVEQLRYIVVELKWGDFKPEHVGQLSFYVALVDDRLRLATHADTVGLLLVRGKSDAVVHYSLASTNAPVGVAADELLPPELQRSLPTEEQLQRALLGTH